MNAAETAIRLAWFEKHKDVMKAHALGATIQVMMPDFGWRDVYQNNPVWSSADVYRVKPEPKKLYRIVGSCGGTYATTFTEKTAPFLQSSANRNGFEAPYTVEEYIQILPEEKQS